MNRLLNPKEQETTCSNLLASLSVDNLNIDINSGVLKVDSNLFATQVTVNLRNTIDYLSTSVPNIGFAKLLSKEVYQAMLASEDVLKKEWDNEREDEAWALLQEEA